MVFLECSHSKDLKTTSEYMKLHIHVVFYSTCIDIHFFDISQTFLSGVEYKGSVRATPNTIQYNKRHF